MSDIDFDNITEFKMIKEVILSSTHTNQGRLHLIEFVDEMIRLLNHKNILIVDVEEYPTDSSEEEGSDEDWNSGDG
tara:strand:- start:369 stop:596 length:228 start_codon:yes stop_codon:yes gene_type:complete